MLKSTEIISLLTNHNVDIKGLLNKSMTKGTILLKPRISTYSTSGTLAKENGAKKVKKQCKIGTCWAWAQFATRW